MIIKIKCKCGTKRVIKKDTLKEARKVKRISGNGNYICDKCWFRLMAKSSIKEIVRGVKSYDGNRQTIFNNL